MAIKNKVQLITYPDSLGGDLRALQRVIDTHLPGIFRGGIHILPPFPSSGDRGFAPLTFLEIDPAFGDWDDVRRIGLEHDLLLDITVNHISAHSPYFQSFLEKGEESPYADMFLTARKIWPGDGPTQEELETIFLRRPEPYSDFTITETGTSVRVWTTFGKVTPSEQVDLDINARVTRQFLAESLATFARNGVKILRLDALPYVIKKPGTTCFFVEPEIWQFMDWLAGLARSLGIVVLPEVHAHHSIQYKLARRGYWIYDFILPYMVLDALFNRTSSRLVEYLRDRPSNQFTTLDCHDGVPVKPDLDGLYDSSTARGVVETCLARGGNLSLIFSPKHRDPDGFDVHQIRGTYYSLLGADDDAYLAARAIQFFVPGVPQVYYVGLLAGENDQEAMTGGEGRDINRHNYSLDEIETELERDVVQRLLKLIRFRNDYAAFNGRFEVLDAGEHKIRLKWSSGERTCTLTVDLTTYESLVIFADDEGRSVEYLV